MMKIWRFRISFFSCKIWSTGLDQIINEYSCQQFLQLLKINKPSGIGSTEHHCVCRFTSSHVVFCWSPQSMADSEAWHRVNTQVPIRSPRYAVFDLAEGTQYKFRVVSANMYGTSEPSEPTGAIETQELKGLFCVILFLSILSLL